MRKSERAPQNDPRIAGIYHGRAFAIVPNSYKFGKTTLVYYQKQILIASKKFESVKTFYYNLSQCYGNEKLCCRPCGEVCRAALGL